MFNFFKRAEAIRTLGNIISVSMRGYVDLLLRTDPAFNHPYKWVYLITRIGGLVAVGIADTKIRGEDTPVVMEQVFSSLMSAETKKQMFAAVTSFAAQSPEQVGQATAAAHLYTAYLDGIKDISTDENYSEILFLSDENKKWAELQEHMDKINGLTDVVRPTETGYLLNAYDTFHMFGMRAE